MIKWDENYSVGIEVFDGHHKKLFDIFNVISEYANEKEENKESMEKILNELMEYTNYHFNEEEKTLESQGYADLETQREEHKDFKATINVFKASYEYGITPPTQDILKFLKNWLENHIKKSDMKYSDFLLEKGFK